MFQTNNIDLVNNQQDQVKVFFYSFFVWTSIFMVLNQKLNIKHIPKKTMDDIKNRVISIIHGIFTFWTACLIMFYESPEYSEMNSQAMQFAMIASAAYFAYDFIACVYYDLADTALVGHHSLAICGYAIAVSSKFGGASSVFGLMCAEVSNFPMHMRCILRSIGFRHTRLYEFFELSYFGLYIVFRGTAVPFMVYKSIPEPMVPLIVKVVASGLLLQSLYFILQMKSILRRLYFQFRERRTKNIHYHWFNINPKICELSYCHKEKKDKIF